VVSCTSRGSCWPAGNRPAYRPVAQAMTIELGKLGVWLTGQNWSAELARELENLGYGALWVGGSPAGDLDAVEGLLGATEHVVVATGIVNMWKDDATRVAASYLRVTGRYPGRFLLGLGIGHPEGTEAYTRPVDKIVSYMDELDKGGVPASGRVLAALGPKVLRLAAQRTAGAHPYLTTPEHTRYARTLLGPGRLLAPEQKFVLGTGRAEARATGRHTVASYLRLSNYRRNLLRTAWTEADLRDGGSDRLVDALVLHGDASTVAAGVRAHWEAGANHVCVQPLGSEPLAALTALGKVLLP
jgi:probable F420-dependent oxidoreductase